MNKFMIQVRDNNYHWGHGDWRPTLEEARNCAREQAERSIHGKARILTWGEKGKEIVERITIAK